MKKYNEVAEKKNYYQEKTTEELLDFDFLLQKISDLHDSVLKMNLDIPKINEAQKIAVEIGLYLQKILKALTEKSKASVYELKGNPFSTKNVALKADLPYSTAYSYLRLLVKAKLVKVTRMENTIQFSENAVELLKKMKHMTTNGDRPKRAVERIQERG